MAKRAQFQAGIDIRTREAEGKVKRLSRSVLGVGKNAKVSGTRMKRQFLSSANAASTLGASVGAVGGKISSMTTGLTGLLGQGGPLALISIAVLGIAAGVAKWRDRQKEVSKELKTTQDRLQNVLALELGLNKELLDARKKLKDEQGELNKLLKVESDFNLRKRATLPIGFTKKLQERKDAVFALELTIASLVRTEKREFEATSEQTKAREKEIEALKKQQEVRVANAQKIFDFERRLAQERNRARAATAAEVSRLSGTPLGLGGLPNQEAIAASPLLRKTIEQMKDLGDIGEDSAARTREAWANAFAQMSSDLGSFGAVLGTLVEGFVEIAPLLIKQPATAKGA